MFHYDVLHTPVKKYKTYPNPRVCILQVTRSQKSSIYNLITIVRFIAVIRLVINALSGASVLYN